MQNRHERGQNRFPLARGAFEQYVQNDPMMRLLEGWGRSARSKTPPGEEPPWSARNFIPYWSQLLSKEAQRGAAIEILNRVDGEAADREAARLRTAGA